MGLSGGLAANGGLPASLVGDRSGVSAPLVDQAGNSLVNIPAWQTATVYPQGYVVQNGGLAYAAATTFTSGASFGADGTNWAPLSSSELSSAQITSNFTTVSTTLVDMTGLTVTVTVGSRPINIDLSASVQNSLAGGFGQIAIIEDGSTTVAGELFGVGTANEVYPFFIRARRAPSAGSHTYKVQANSNSASNTVTVRAAATNPVLLQVNQM